MKKGKKQSKASTPLTTDVNLEPSPHIWDLLFTKRIVLSSHGSGLTLVLSDGMRELNVTFAHAEPLGTSTDMLAYTLIGWKVYYPRPSHGSLSRLLLSPSIGSGSESGPHCPTCKCFYKSMTPSQVNSLLDIRAKKPSKRFL